MTHWTDQALCKGAPLDVFVPSQRTDDYTPEKHVRDLCLRCPIAKQCLETAIEDKLTGIWGGTTDAERRRIRSIRSRRRKSRV